MNNWQTMDSAPRDGSPFLVQTLPYASPRLCMRRIQFSVGKQGEIIPRDLGSWLHVAGIDDDAENSSTSIPQPQWSIAPDDLNNVSAWRWRPIPDAPEEVLTAIRSDLGWPAAGNRTAVPHDQREPESFNRG